MVLIINLIPVFSEDLVEYFEKQPLPCVWLNLKRSHGAVYPDEVSGAELAVNYLIKKGKKRIGYFCNLHASPAHFSVMDRFAGYCSALKAAGFSSHRHLQLLGTSAEAMEQDGNLDRANLFLKTFPDVDSVVCYEYGEAMCLMMAAERAGRRVPDSIEIIGFHEREIRASSGISLPTVIIPFQEVGTHAVHMIRQMIDTQSRDIPSVAVRFKSVLI